MKVCTEAMHIALATSAVVLMKAGWLGFETSYINESYVYIYVH